MPGQEPSAAGPCPGRRGNRQDPPHHLHASKGREFDTVILPGLLNGITPRDVPERGKWRRPTAKELAEQRRAFYVALTRAETTLHLIIGPGYHTKNGYWIGKGPSDFVVEMARRLPPVNSAE
ncbi:3'-5' exonuclease [Streptomyces sp. CA-132043]|uniref:3'-5' exonuclease n=1 Tax=Streptomyces sp. CA-132043 TaxID=3240048 RepID=UPI003D940B4F